MKYIVGSGFHCKPGQTFEQFYPIWWDNLMRHANPKPERVLILATGGNSVPNALGQWIPLSGDLGHVHDLNNHRKPYHWCGWSIAFCTLALLAYADECDFLFLEQDVLAFGPWVKRMYDEIGDAGMIFGKAKCMPAVQSLVLCKHWFIPEFVRLFLGTGSEQIKANEGELKFMRLEKQYPNLFARYSFGVDRDRPLPFDDEVWYAQHLSALELAQIVEHGLLPKDTPILANTWAK